jgi:type I restriction enzyme S subunit
MSDDLPEGWTETTVSAVARDINYGFTAKSSSSAAGPKYLRITDIQHGSVDWTSVPHCEVPRKKNAYSLLPGDVVFARTGATTGKSYLITSCPDAVFASYLIRVRPSPGVLPEFLYFFFQSHGYWTQISENISGSAQPNCNASKLSALTIGLAPMDEQRRIVAQLESLLAKVRSSQERLDKIPTILRRFRQAVLAAACAGRLTADWRQEHANVESASVLVNRIEALREAAFTPKSKGGERKLNPRTEVARVEVLGEEDRPEESIPETWIWVRFGSIIGELRNGVSPRPKVDPPGTPILRISAARQGSVDLADIRYMPDAGEFLPQYALRDDDLLFTRYNGSIELLGVCGMVRGLGKRTILYPDKLMRVRVDHELVLPNYTEIFFQNAAVHDRIVAKSKSSAGQNGVSGSDIKVQPFALPPLPEQQEVIRRVQELFTLADRIEARYEKAKAQADRLTPSLLAKAFSGELVTTEAKLAKAEGRSYETAPQLLERIKGSQTGAPRRTRSRVSTKRA